MKKHFWCIYFHDKNKYILLVVLFKGRNDIVLLGGAILGISVIIIDIVKIVTKKCYKYREIPKNKVLVFIVIGPVMAKPVLFNMQNKRPISTCTVTPKAPAPTPSQHICLPMIYRSYSEPYLSCGGWLKFYLIKTGLYCFVINVHLCVAFHGKMEWIGFCLANH